MSSGTQLVTVRIYTWVWSPPMPVFVLLNGTKSGQADLLTVAGLLVPCVCRLKGSFNTWMQGEELWAEENLQEEQGVGPVVLVWVSKES